MFENRQPDLYLPRPAVIKEIVEENSQIKTFVLAFADQQYNAAFTYQPGQFLMVSVPHCGEAPISFSSTPASPGTFHLSVRLAGTLTAAMHNLNVGDAVGIRGPYGRPFPLTLFQGRDLLFVAGGIGLAPLRSVINTCLEDEKLGVGNITILYGSRSPADIAFEEDLEHWRNQKHVTCLLTVDYSATGWDGHVGLVTDLLDNCSLARGNTIALVCGPALMIRATLAELKTRDFADEDIITTLERHMKCGVGICRHCHMDEKLVCKDGPVFSLAELKSLEISELQS